MVEVRVVLEIDGGSSCGSRNGSWKFVWFNNLMVEVRVFDKLMVEIRVVLEIDGGSSCGSRNGWWKFV
jgi:very-short-patch-repair endonuclease